MTHFVWDFSPEIIDLGFFAPRWYGVCFATAILIAQHIMWRFYQDHPDRTEDQFNAGFIWLVVSLIVGARLGHILFYDPSRYFHRPWAIFAVWEGGLASHGATIGMFLGTYFYTLKHRIPMIWFADRIILGVLIGGACIRLGNFFNSEIIGKPSDVPWAIVFKRVDDIARHPSQLYESLSYFLGFVLFMLAFRIYKDNAKGGKFLGAGLIWIFTARFLIEFTKEHHADFEAFLPINMGQILSLPLIAVGVCFWMGLHNRIWFLREQPFVGMNTAHSAPKKKKKKK